MRTSPLSRRQLMAFLGAFGVASEALAQDAAKVDPRNFRVVFENDRVRVLDYASTPGSGVCGVGRHWHPAHVTVQLTSVTLRLTDEAGQTKVLDVPAGAIFWEEAVTHTTENLAGAGAHAYVIEIKDTKWKPASGTG